MRVPSQPEGKELFSEQRQRSVTQSQAVTTRQGAFRLETRSARSSASLGASRDPRPKWITQRNAGPPADSTIEPFNLRDNLSVTKNIPSDTPIGTCLTRSEPCIKKAFSEGIDA